MSYRQRLPHPALREVVKCYWHLEAVDAGGPHVVLPDGCMEFIVHFGALPRVTGRNQVASSSQRAFVGGQITEAIRLEGGGPLRMVGVRLQPWSGAALLGMAMHEIAHQSVALGDIAKGTGDDLPARLATARGAAERFDIVDGLMLELARRSRPVSALATAAIAQLDRSHGGIGIAALAAGLSVSERHLHRTLQHHVGLSAKSYGRIRRLQHCIAAIRQGRVTTLTDAAHHAGYSDQAHFSHDLKKLCGVSPGTLLHERRLLVEPGL